MTHYILIVGVFCFGAIVTAISVALGFYLAKLSTQTTQTIIHETREDVQRTNGGVIYMTPEREAELLEADKDGA